tara:strand:- start:4955 stop:5785 length:831 start_codon:yes stop_codon:yes gene_type:complete
MEVMRNFIKGIFMGMAEIIPGISGGTLALILGIYERLINAIAAFNFNTFHLFRSAKFKEVWKTIDGNFLLILGLGMLTSIFTLSYLILIILSNYPLLLKSILTGLLLGCLFSHLLRPQFFSLDFLKGFVFSFLLFLTILFSKVHSLEEVSSIYIFLCGFLAIFALVLPGISGSFILLILGIYPLMIKSITILDFSVLGAFLLGSLLGLFTSVNLIKKLYESNKGLLISFFFGLILFSIPLLWQDTKFDSGLSLLEILCGLGVGFLLILSLFWAQKS